MDTIKKQVRKEKLDNGKVWSEVEENNKRIKRIESGGKERKKMVTAVAAKVDMLWRFSKGQGNGEIRQDHKGYGKKSR